MRKRKAETIPANTTMQQAIDMIKRLRAEKEALMVHLKESRYCSACVHAKEGNGKCYVCELGIGSSQFEFKGFSEEIYKGGRDA